jgi:hypothetical protein
LSGLSAIAGLVFGLGVVFAITPIDMGPTYGRRSRDKVTGRRSADASIATEFTPASNYDPRDAQGLHPESTYTPQSKTQQPDALDRTSAATNDVMELLAKTNNHSADNLFAEIMEKSMSGHRRAKMNMQLDIEPGDDLTTPPSSGPNSSKSETGKSLPSTNSSDANRVRFTTEVDNAFRELARLKSLQPDSHGEEQNIDEKINEIKALLEAMGYPANTEILKKEGYIRPRPSQS